MRVDTAEAELLRRLKAHDPAAWSELYDLHYRAIWRYALARTGNPAVADDLAAQVFLEALESIQRYQPRGKPIIAWLYTIARNHAAWSARRRRREVGPIEPDAPQSTTDDVLETLVLTEALNRLTRLQREIIALRHYAGYSTSEIAALLRKNERAVYSAEARALATLRRVLSTDSENLPTPPDEIRPAGAIED